MAHGKSSISHKEDSSTRTSHGDAYDAQKDWTVEEEQAVRKKVDRRIFPMLCIVFGLSLIDRTNISAAYVAGLGRDLHLDVGSRYNLALLIFCVSYALFDLPSNIIIRRVGARRWLSFLICAWGCIVLGIGFVDDWRFLIVLRTLLGVFEAGILPGAVYIISSWYRQFESAKRMSICIGAAQLFLAFGPVIAYVLSLIRVGDRKFSQGWRWIFLVEGMITIVAGLLSPIFLVDFPEKAGFLTDRQKYIATSRVSLEQEGAHAEHVSFKDSLKILWDWKIGVYCVQHFVVASSIYSLNFFLPIILRDNLGFSYALSQLLCTPPYVFGNILPFVVAYWSDKHKLRWPMLVSQSVSVIIGLLIAMYTKPPGVRYFGIFLAAFGTQANVPATLVYGQNQTAKVQKRAVVAAAMVSAGGLGGICGSLIFRRQDAPWYFPGMWATIALQMLYSIVTICMSMHFTRMNRLADEGKKTSLEGVQGFRYAP
ncbi:hypothetical protein DPSP01_011921 [Paraphaeosphaeria sporulosa]